MTDQQPHAPGGPGTSGSWQPVPGGGDYDPDQTMHVSFAAQLPPEPLPGEDPLGAHGPVGPGGPVDPATTWTIPVIRDDADDSGEYSGEYAVGAFAPSWDQAPSPAPPTTQSFPAGMFGQGAAAAQAAARARAAEAQSPAAPAGGDPGPWTMPFTGPEGGDAVPWLPAHAPAADAAWTGVVDDPDRPPVDPAPFGHPADDSAESADGPAGYGSSAPPADGYRAPDGYGEEPYAQDAYAGAPFTTEQARGAYAEDGESAYAEDGNAYGDAANAYPGDGEGPYTRSAEDGFTADGDAFDPGAAGGSPDGEDGPVAGEFADRGAEAEDDGFAAADGDTGAEGAFDPENPESVGDPAHAPVFEDEPEPEPEPVEETRSEHPLASYMLRVNGTERPVTDAWLGESLLYVLRERLGLAGAKDGCEQGECGACSVQVDGRLVASCLVPAATAAGSEVRTVEGLTVDGRPSDVQRALADCGAVQCGFCIPGMAMTVHDLLEGNHQPTDLDVRHALSGNLCRCSGYRGVIDAVRQVVAARGSEDDPAGDDPARIPHQSGPAGTAGLAGGAQ